MLESAVADQRFCRPAGRAEVDLEIVRRPIRVRQHPFAEQGVLLAYRRYPDFAVRRHALACVAGEDTVEHVAPRTAETGARCGRHKALPIAAVLAIDGSGEGSDEVPSLVGMRCGI